MIRLAPRLRPGVASLRRCVLDRPAGGVLIAVAGVLDQFLLGLLKALGLSLPGLDQRPLRLIWPSVGSRSLGAGTPADPTRLPGGPLGLLLGQRV